MPETLQIIITFNDNKLLENVNCFFQKKIANRETLPRSPRLLRKSNESRGERWVSVFMDMKPSHPPAT